MCRNITADTIRWPNVVLSFGQRCRQWANSKPTLGQRLMFAGMATMTNYKISHHIILYAGCKTIVDKSPYADRLHG